MSANNQVIIRKIHFRRFDGFEVDVDAYGEPENQEYYDSKKPDFTAETLEGAIKAYCKYCEELAKEGRYIEYGLVIEGI